MYIGKPVYFSGVHIKHLLQMYDIFIVIKHEK
jgi:hypothetical protein